MAQVSPSLLGARIMRKASARYLNSTQAYVGIARFGVLLLHGRWNLPLPWEIPVNRFVSLGPSLGKHWPKSHVKLPVRLTTTNNLISFGERSTPKRRLLSWLLGHISRGLFQKIYLLWGRGDPQGIPSFRTSWSARLWCFFARPV